MKLFWRYLLFHYLKLLSLSVCGLIAILLTMRLDDIAHFACLGGGWWASLQFIFLQIPYLMPLALPLAALMSAYLTLRRLNTTHELTALRSSGLSLRAILAPLIAGGGMLMGLNFYLVSEVAPQAHLTNSLLKKELKSLNPLVMLSNKRLLQMQGIYGEVLGDVDYGLRARDVLMVIPGIAGEPQRLLLAKELTAVDERLAGRNVTFLWGEPEEKGGFDKLMVENIAELEMPLNDFSPFLRQKAWSLQPDHLPLPILFSAIAEERELLPEQEARHKLNAAYAEVARRLSLSFAMLTFTFFGAAAAIQVGRQQRLFPLVMLIGLAAFYLVAYFVAKALEDHWQVAAALYFLPHLLIIAVSLWRLMRCQRGLE